MLPQDLPRAFTDLYAQLQEARQRPTTQLFHALQRQLNTLKPHFQSLLVFPSPKPEDARRLETQGAFHLICYFVLAHG